MSTSTTATEIARYLNTGATDVLCQAWEGSLVERAQLANKELRGALIDEVRRRTPKASVPILPTPGETRSLTRRKVEPMVRGLFSRAEQDQVLALVERSVVFLTPATIDEILQTETWDKTAWDLANMYLGSFESPLLGPTAPAIVGMSQEATCFVSPGYFTDVEHPFSDFVVHEVAHIFHNCKRRTAGLPFTRRREWLLDIAFKRRETFAYGCEVFARIVERATSPTERRALADEAGRTFRPADDRVDGAELAEILEEAAARRNGWKVILSRCAPPQRR